MTLFDTIAILFTLAALFSYLNYKFIKLPTTIGLMFFALVLSIVIIGLGHFFPSFKDTAQGWIAGIDFNQALMNGMLSFLLFAGALHVELEDLAQQKWIIAFLATLGVVGCTFIVGGLMFFLLPMLGLELPFILCLVFGSLISPTDPIAVLGLLKQAGAPKSLETKIIGESLFNDGVGVVVFAVIVQIAFPKSGHAPDAAHIALLFLEEAGGGILFGLLLGWGAYRLLKGLDHYIVETMITLAVVTGGYALAMALHLSGPIAMVVAGLMIGNQGRRFAMGERTVERLDIFWEMIDEFLNAVLFVLIGLEVLILSLRGDFLLAGVLAIGVALFGRFIAVGAGVQLLKIRRTFTPHVVKMMTWGGLRGGISVALALSLPKGDERDLILTITYVVVAFSILVQGLSMKTVTTRLLKKDA